MIFIMAAAAIVVAVLILTEPRLIEASAQVPKNSRERLPLGKRFSFSRDLIVRIQGSSAEHLDIHEGQYLKARKLKASERLALSPDDIVVIKSRSAQGDNPYRVRQISKLDDDRVYFKNPPSSQFDSLKDRDLDVIYAKVTHIEKMPA